MSIEAVLLFHFYIISIFCFFNKHITTSLEDNNILMSIQIAIALNIINETYFDYF